jgi:mycothiol synthase
MVRLEPLHDRSAHHRSAVIALLRDVERQTGEPPLPDHIRLAFEHGVSDLIAVIAWHGGSAVGYAQAVRGDDSISLATVLARDLHAAVADQVTKRLVEAVCARIAAEGGGEVFWWIADTRADVHERWMAAAEASGFRLDRTLLQLRVDLPIGATSPFDIETRAFVPGVDEEAWLDVNNAAFDSHPEQGGWTHDTLMLRERETWFDPTGILMHERDGRLAAFCWTKVHRDTDPMMGEIYVIAVRPDFHGLGLGRAMAVAGLAHITAQGLGVGMLYVDEANVAAVTLYRSLGFTEHHHQHSMVGVIAAATTHDDSPARATP